MAAATTRWDGGKQPWLSARRAAASSCHVAPLRLVAALVTAAAVGVAAGGVVCEDNRGQGGAFRMLQPADMDLVMHGAGQDAASFRDYWDYMGNTTKPMVFMTYTSLRMTQPEIEAYFMQLEADCAAYGDERFVLPQIGLSMTAGGQGYDDDVAAGKLDDNIGWFATAISQQLKRPCYVRIGYEFNGQWNKYNVSTYPQAFNRVAKVLRDTKMVATVWDYSADAQVNRLDFLQWVTEPALTDWIGVNIFSGASQATAPGSGVTGSKVVERFLEEYSDNPYQAIMIGESTPRGSGAQGGNNSWGQWYEPYFTMINDGDYNFQSFK